MIFFSDSFTDSTNEMKANKAVTLSMASVLVKFTMVVVICVVDWCGRTCPKVLFSTDPSPFRCLNCVLIAIKRRARASLKNEDRISRIILAIMWGSDFVWWGSDSSI